MSQKSNVSTPAIVLHALALANVLFGLTLVLAAILGFFVGRDDEAARGAHRAVLNATITYYAGTILLGLISGLLPGTFTLLLYGGATIFWVIALIVGSIMGVIAALNGKSKENYFGFLPLFRKKGKKAE